MSEAGPCEESGDVSSKSHLHPCKDKTDYGSNGASPVSKRKYRYIPLEVVALLFFTQLYMVFTYLQFYIETRATLYYDNIHPFNGSITKSKLVMNREIAIQGLATKYLVTIIACAMLPCSVSVLLAGALSDTSGRKVPMYMSSIGALVLSVNIILVVRFEADVYLICIGAVVSGLCGSFGTMLTSLLSIVSDITEPGPSRTWRILLVTILLSTGNILGTPLVGVWIEAAGYLDVLYLFVALCVTVLLIVVFFVPETVDKKTDKLMSFWDNVKVKKEGFSFYLKDNAEHPKKIVLLCLTTLLIDFAVGISKWVILPQYLLASPFYWTPTQITLFLSIRSSVALVAILLTSRFLSQFVSDVHMAILGMMSRFLSLIFIACSINDTMMYIAGVASVYADVLNPSMMSFMSRIAPPSEQGSTFSVIVLFELLASSVFIVLAGVIYQSTLSIFPGFVFIVLSLLMLVVLIILIVLTRFDKQRNHKKEEINIEYPTQSE